jgi:serine/threonine protein phosphatase PrpC
VEDDDAPVQRWSWASADGGWDVVALSHIGRVRRQLQDAWAVAFDLPFGPVPVDAFAVFDGLGGHPNGREAARMAARALPEAVRSAQSLHEILPRLDPAVAATGGRTTAVAALFPRGGGKGFLVSAGDSSAYALQDGRLELLVQRDRIARNVVTDLLGAGRVRGRVREVSIASGALLLCSDGVDDVLGPEPLRALVAAPRAGMAQAVERTMALVLEAGAPDNATLLLARRRGWA